MHLSLRLSAALAFACLAVMPPAQAHAAQIQMLPPVTEATKDQATPTVCPSGTTSNLLTWDGQAPLSCASGVSAAGGNITASGSIMPGTSDPKTGTAFTAGTACAAEGAMGYDLSAHKPVFCGKNLVWTAIGGLPKRIVCTYGRNTPQSNSYYGQTVWGGNLFLHTFSPGECTGGVLPDSNYTAITPNWVGGCFVATETLEAFQYGSPYFPGFEMGVTNCESSGAWSVTYIQTDTSGQTAPYLDSPEWNYYESTNGSPIYN